MLRRLESSSALGLCGALLSAAHVVSYFSWSVLERDFPAPVCWPHLPFCGPVSTLLLHLYLVTALASGALWLMTTLKSGKKLVPFAYAALGAALAVRVAIFFQDYRFLEAVELISFSLTAIFLFSRARASLLRLAFVALLILGGLARLGPGWFTDAGWNGAALTVFGIGLSVFLLSRKRRVVVATTLLGAACTLACWKVLGLGPTLELLAFLPVFVLLHRERLQYSHGLWALLPALLIARQWALPPVPMYCDNLVLVHGEDGIADESYRPAGVSARLRCDPVLYEAYARSFCEKHVRVELYLNARRAGESGGRELVSAPDFCANALRSGRTSDSWPLPLGDARKAQELAGASAPTFVYRGDAARAGTVTQGTLPTHLELAWKREGINIGVYHASKSTPAVDATGVYVGGDSGWFQSFDLDGKPRWRFHVGNAPDGIHGTAALDETKVYFGAYNGMLYALDKRDGTLVWAVRLGDVIGSSPAIVGDSVLVAVETDAPKNGFVVKVRRSDGHVEWYSAPLGHQGHGSPAVSLERKLVFEGANNGRMTALDLDTGAQRWRTEGHGAIKSTAALVGDGLYYTSWGERLTAVDPANGRIRWLALLDARSQSSPTYVPGEDAFVVGANDGSLKMIRRKDGSLAWRIKAEGTAKTQAKSEDTKRVDSALAIRDASSRWVVWTLCQSETLCALDARSGRVLERLALHAPFTSVPVYFGGALYVSADFPGSLMKFAPASQRKR